MSSAGLNRRYAELDQDDEEFEAYLYELPSGSDLPAYGRKLFKPFYARSRYSTAQPSRQIVVDGFEKTSSLIIISRDTPISDRAEATAMAEAAKADSKDEAAELTRRREERSRKKFVDLAYRLEEIDRENEAVLTWVLKAPSGDHESKAWKAFRFFQSCLAAASKNDDLRAWLVARGSIVLGDASETWCRDAFASAKSNSSNCERTSAGQFFRTLNHRPWSDFQSVTAFLESSEEADDDLAIEYWSHRRNLFWHHGIKRVSHSKKRDRFTRQFYNGAKAVSDGETGSEAISNLTRSGFSIFRIEEFLDLK